MPRIHHVTRSWLLTLCGYSVVVGVLIYVFVNHDVATAVRAAVGWAALMFVYGVIRSIARNRPRP